MTSIPLTRTGKIARLPHDIREQLNLRIQNGEQGKSILKWLNALPEVLAILNEHFKGRPIAPSNLTEWKAGGYRDWLVRQDALTMVENLSDESTFGDKSLATDLNEKVARWASIQIAATAQVLIRSELAPDAKWTRLRQLTGELSRLRRNDLLAVRLEIDRQRLALEQSKTDAHLEKEFESWLKRPEIQKRFKLEPLKGLSRDALTLVDNYLCHDISPLDPEEAKKLYPFGRYATKPPIGFELPTAPQTEPNTAASPISVQPANGPTDNATKPSSVETEESDLPTTTPCPQPVNSPVPVNGDGSPHYKQFLTSTCTSAGKESEQEPLSSSPNGTPTESAPSKEILPPPPPPAIEQPPPQTYCANCGGELPPGEEGFHCRHCGKPLSAPGAKTFVRPAPSSLKMCHHCHSVISLTPGSAWPVHCRSCGSCLPTADESVEHCPDCGHCLPFLPSTGKRPQPNCAHCGKKLPPPLPRLE